ncbi:protein-export chaperone SecB [Bacteroides graminisolvens]|jgi:preprotein translocase subunit SecB|uniref:protein-export chaperone SecB n=1 Tax=Bacteroides graminisolvens TaxID=477666 RepID=UPI0023F393B6|nr:protein-export chaperone SecB [Bacteroides graminisolvens]MDD3211349.1 protein-export chaperone SecB [Bacteroides graminisolvens]
MAEQIANFRFKGYKIIDSTIRISEEMEISSKLEINFEQTIGSIIEEGMYKHTLTTKITNDNSSMNIEVKAVGFFEFDKSLSNELLQDFFQKNAPAILFPYVRAYISTLTGLSGVAPLILPTLNLSKR